MIQVLFKNLKPSELIRQAIADRLSDDLVRFPDLTADAISVLVEMENSPTQAGPDLFRVKLRVTKGRYRGVILEKTANSFYIALADLNENLVERLNRFGDKQRAKRRKQAQHFGDTTTF